MRRHKHARMAVTMRSKWVPHTVACNTLGSVGAGPVLRQRLWYLGHRYMVFTQNGHVLWAQ